MSAPLLVVDAYLDADRPGLGGARNVLPRLGAQRSRVVRAAFEPLPASGEDFAGIVITGSAASVLDERPWIAPLEALVRDAAARRVPLLGLCFGHQVLARALLGPAAVRPSPTPELGWEEVEILRPDPLLDLLPRRFRCFASHADEVDPGAPGLVSLARSERCAVQALRAPDAPLWGVQFHAEMGAAESEELVRSRAAAEPGRAERLLAGRVDTAPLFDALLEGFLRIAAR